MKKIALFALAALCTAAAQAWTINWTTGIGETVNDKTVVDPTWDSGISCNSATFAILVNFNSADISGNAKVMTFGTWSGHGGVISGWLDVYALNQDGGDVVSYTTGGTPTTPDGANTVALAAGKCLITTVFEKTGTDTTLLKGYINDTLVYSQELTSMNGLNAYTYTSGDFTLEGAAAYEGALTEDQIGYLVDNNTAVLPEPTALALLALGVAGLALKRKNA